LRTNAVAQVAIALTHIRIILQIVTHAIALLSQEFLEGDRITAMDDHTKQQQNPCIVAFLVHERLRQREFDEIQPLEIHAQWDLQSSYPRKSGVN
jgi:hypothetical protein